MTEALPQKDENQLGRVGYQSEGRSGSFLVEDARVREARPQTEQIEILPLSAALERHDWLRALSFQLVDRDQDEFTRAAADGTPLGCFIRVLAGQQIALPIQTCFYMRTPGSRQVIHNILVVEEEAQVDFIHGCTVARHLEAATHIGVTECYVGRNARVSTSMIHSWAPGVEVFPRSAARVEEGARFVSTYIIASPAKRVQMYPEARVGAHALAEFCSVVHAPPGSCLDLGARAWLQGAGASAEIVSRVVSSGGTVTTRGHIIGEVDEVRGSMTCSGLLLGQQGRIHAIPELEGRAPRVQLSHEASVGMISPEELAYLMASGMDEEKARSLIIHGFLDAGVRVLPAALRQSIASMIEQARIGRAI